MLAVTYVVGQFMALFINSAVGLGLLLMASVYPLLIALGVDEETAYEDSCKIEHDLSDITFLKLKEHMEKHIGK